jgi:hypothetical protein
MAALSGAISAPRAPASTAMLHSVKRASTDSASMAAPQNSIASRARPARRCG